ncbi:replication initiator protein [Blackfly microvirus SF02]|uniref:Replication initiator protein n=1 Tax=Blackfly microvirus SF02 TaxID=2576452 RepID=A0A4P8PPH4_9VIRU|nr:replication initiator protein [Blackfly microvirus SF02]
MRPLARLPTPPSEEALQALDLSVGGLLHHTLLDYMMLSDRQSLNSNKSRRSRETTQNEFSQLKILLLSWCFQDPRQKRSRPPNARRHSPLVPCYGPHTAYYPKADATDKKLVFRKDQSETGIALKIPCGKCFGCLLERSRQWAMRCMHEKRMHRTGSAFLTLTYDEKNNPGTLVKADLQNFMKKLRNRRPPGLRFFACGEYGEHFLRPHFHVLLFNTHFADQKNISKLNINQLNSEYQLSTSAELSVIWPFGLHRIGDVNFQSCAYVARYIMKKQVEKPLPGLAPEFVVMSRRPGLGAGYFDRYQSEIINHDKVIINGTPVGVPRFYDNRISQLDANMRLPHQPSLIEEIKTRRRRELVSPKGEKTSARMRTKELVAMARLKQKGRTI